MGADDVVTAADGVGAHRPKGSTKPSVSRRPNEEAIFNAALAAFAERGYNGASMRAIATRAGTSLSNLYNYWPGKDDLLAHVLQRANDDLLLHLERDLAAAADLRAIGQLAAAVTSYARWSMGQQTAGLVAIGEFRYLGGQHREVVVAARDRTEALFVSIVESGASSGEFRTPHPQAAARNIVLMCAGVAAWYRSDGDRPPLALAREQAHLALAMVEAAS